MLQTRKTPPVAHEVCAQNRSLRLILCRVWQGAFVLEDLSKIAAIDPPAAGGASDEVLGLFRRLNADPRPDISSRSSSGARLARWSGLVAVNVDHWLEPCGQERAVIWPGYVACWTGHPRSNHSYMLLARPTADRDVPRTPNRCRRNWSSAPSSLSSPFLLRLALHGRSIRVLKLSQSGDRPDR
jgi:hypothetical protein